jgi:hypothetical protein
MSKIMEAARELFGKRRFEEVGGALWLDEARILRIVQRGTPLKHALRRWEEGFRRDSEEGRYRRGRSGPRKRVARFSELDNIDPTTHVRRSW